MSQSPQAQRGIAYLHFTFKGNTRLKLLGPSGRSEPLSVDRLGLASSLFYIFVSIDADGQRFITLESDASSHGSELIATLEQREGAWYTCVPGGEWQKRMHGQLILEHECCSISWAL